MWPWDLNCQSIVDITCVYYLVNEIWLEKPGLLEQRLWTKHSNGPIYWHYETLYYVHRNDDIVLITCIYIYEKTNGFSRCVMAWTTARITRLRTRLTTGVRRTSHARRTIWSVKRRTYAWNRIGCAMATTTAGTTVTRTRFTALRGPARPTASDARTIGAYRPRGIAMETTTAATGRTSHRSTASQRAAPVSVIYSPATTVTAYRGFTSATATTIAWTTPTKTRDTSAVSLKQ